MTRLKPKDIIAFMTILFIFGLKAMQINTSLDAVLALILGYYFVKRQNGNDNGE